MFFDLVQCCHLQGSWLTAVDHNVHVLAQFIGVGVQGIVCSAFVFVLFHALFNGCPCFM